jgi:membrane fusion protein, heavy metal efflux system
MKNALSLLPILLLAACHADAPSAATAPPVKLKEQTLTFTAADPMLPSFIAQPVETQDKLAVKLTGRLIWDEDITTHVFSPVAGRVSSIKAALGEKVSVGSELARILSPDYGQAQADALKADSDFALAKRNLERARELLAGKVIAQKEVDAAESMFRDAQSELERANARLKEWGGEGEVKVGDGFKLKASMQGEIVERSINPGQEIRADQMLAGESLVAAPLFVISDPSRLWVQLDVTEADLSKLKPGSPLRLHCSAYPDRIFEGTLDVIGSVLDSDTRTVKARGSLQNVDRLLKAEMYVNAEVVTTIPPAANVPKHAVFLREGLPTVFVKQDDLHFEMRRVQSGAESDGHVLVTAGLKSGESIVTDGALLLESVFDAQVTTANPQS